MGKGQASGLNSVTVATPPPPQTGWSRAWPLGSIPQGQVPAVRTQDKAPIQGHTGGCVQRHGLPRGAWDPAPARPTLPPARQQQWAPVSLPRCLRGPAPAGLEGVWAPLSLPGRPAGPRPSSALLPVWRQWLRHGAMDGPADRVDVKNPTAPPRADTDPEDLVSGVPCPERITSRNEHGAPDSTAVPTQVPATAHKGPGHKTPVAGEGETLRKSKYGWFGLIFYGVWAQSREETGRGP